MQGARGGAAGSNVFCTSSSGPVVLQASPRKLSKCQYFEADPLCQIANSRASHISARSCEHDWSFEILRRQPNGQLLCQSKILWSEILQEQLPGAKQFPSPNKCAGGEESHERNVWHARFWS